VRRPIFRADWLDVLFVHFETDAGRLQRSIPLALDLFGGRAYVSLIGFTQHRLRPALGGRVGQWLSGPLASHEFLNVRTYVRHRGGARGEEKRGIYFIAEWIPSRVAALIGPSTYGLPYRLGRMRYSPARREVVAGQGKLELFAPQSSDPLHAAAPGTMEAFLLERYTAFTCRRGVTRRFDVGHDPWMYRSLDADVVESTLLSVSGDWFSDARLAGAHWSPGVRDVTIGRPRRVEVTGHGAGAVDASATIAQ
jgi:uncharacterized protein YqjF (DUF2071 family)